MVIDWEMRPRQTLDTKLNLSPHILKENQQTRDRAMGIIGIERLQAQEMGFYWTLNPERDIAT